MQHPNVAEWTWEEMEKFVENYSEHKAVCRRVVSESRLPEPQKHAKKDALHRYQTIINCIND